MQHRISREDLKEDSKEEIKDNWPAEQETLSSSPSCSDDARFPHFLFVSSFPSRIHLRDLGDR